MSRSLRPRLTILRIKKSKHLHQGIAASLSIFKNFAAGQLYTSTYGYAYGYFLAYGYGFRPNLNNYGYGYSYGAPDTYGYGFTGARTFSYLVTLSPSSMALGSHNLRAVIETGLSPIAAFTSQTIDSGVTPEACTPYARAGGI